MRSTFTVALLIGLTALLLERPATADTRQALEEEARRHGAPMAWIPDGAFRMGTGSPKGAANVAPAVDSDEAGQSPYGIFGMAGNVSEWVSDWYGDASYGLSLARNPQGPASGTRKVIRGGSFGDLAAWVNAASRDSSAPTDLGAFAGIRCARDAF